MVIPLFKVGVFFIMAKDSFWFKHDSSSGRGIKIRTIQHIHGHWGKGVYWDVLEILREQDGYKYEHSEMSLGILCSLIGIQYDHKFINWFSDCKRLELFKTDDSHFWSDVLCENMEVWEKKKDNGNQGGRPKKNLTNNLNETKGITETKPNDNLNHNLNETKVSDLGYENTKANRNHNIYKTNKNNIYISTNKDLGLSETDKDYLPVKQLFRDSPFFLKDNFKKRFNGWPDGTVDFYHKKALSWSNENEANGKGLKMDWGAEIDNWVEKDKLNGIKISFDKTQSHSRSAQPVN